MNSYTIPIKSQITSTVTVDAGSLEEAIGYAIDNPPQSDIGNSDFDASDEWEHSGGYYKDGEHHSGGMPASTPAAKVKPQSVAERALRELLKHLDGNPAAIALVSDTGHHTFAVWGGTEETNISAMVKATAGIGMNTPKAK